MNSNPPDHNPDDPLHDPRSSRGERRFGDDELNAELNADLHEDLNASDTTSPNAMPVHQADTSHRQAPQRHAAAEFCSYCGAKLNLLFYFCTSCGTPYKEARSVLTPDTPREFTEGELIRVKAPNVWPLFWTYVSVAILGSVITTLFSLDKDPLVGFGIQISAILITTCVFSVMYWPTLAVQFKRFGFLHWAAWAGLLLLIPVLAINYGWHTWLENMMAGEAEDPIETLSKQLGRGTMVLLICVFPAVVEEIAFRGLVQHWLQTALRPWRAIVLASFLFTVMHGFAILSWPYLFMVGALLGWTKWKTNSLYPSMVIHFIHNFVVIEYFH